MLISPMQGMLLGVLLGSVLILVHNLLAARRRRLEEDRRAALRTFAGKRGFTVLEDHVPDRAEDVGHIFQGHPRRKARLTELLLGSDQHGTYYVCRREVQGRQHHAVLFETRIQGLASFRVEPLRGGRRPDGSSNWLSALAGSFGRRRRAPLRLRVTWDVDPATMDARAAALAPQLVSEVAGVNTAHPGAELHLELHHDKAVIHSRMPADREAFITFVEAAQQLRDRLHGALVTGARENPSRAVTPISGQPAAASKSVPKPATKPVSARFAFKPIDPANITAMDLVREPDSKRVNTKHFEIPEPEEEVIVLSGSYSFRR